MAFLRACCHLVSCNFKNSHQSSWHISETGKDILMKINIEINYDILISNSIILITNSISNSINVWYLAYTAYKILGHHFEKACLSPTHQSDAVFLSFYYYYFYLFFFYFTILHWFCHTSTCICHGCKRVPHPEPPSHLPPHTIPLGHPSAPAPSFLYPASNLEWRFLSSGGQRS